ncbi:MAG: WG repeat-containing protein [Tannerella sp.]|nr:WG repeat-containing protein [Tannerella sp.]
MKKKTLLSFFICCAAIFVSFLTDHNTTVLAGTVKDFEIEWIIPPTKLSGKDFAQGRVWGQKEWGGPWTLFDDKGNILKDGVEAYAIGKYDISGYCKFNPNKDDKDIISFFDREGNVVISPDRYDDISIHEGLIAKKNENGLLGFVNMSGEWAVSPEYDAVGPFSEGLASVKKGDKRGYIDKEGNVVIDFKFDKAFTFLKGAAFVEANSLCGFIGKNGELLTESVAYEGFTNFYRDNLIGAVKDGKFGFIDAKGNVVIDFKYEPVRSFAMYNFNQGRAVVLLNGESDEYGVIDETGKVIFTLRGSKGRLFYPGSKDEEFIRIYKSIRLIGGFEFCWAAFNGGYLTTYDSTEVVIYDRDGNSYPMSKYLSPSMIVYASENDIFRTTDLFEHKTGYFTIIPKER